MTHTSFRFLTTLSLATVLLVTVAACTEDQSVEPTPTNSTSDPVSPTNDAPEVMPDFVGEPVEQAVATLSSYNAQITQTRRVAPDSPGTVIDQSPVAGSPFTQFVELVVSVAPPKVPDVEGKSFGQAEAELRELGFTVREEPVFDEEKVDGYVLEQQPPAGASNAGEVVLRVVRRPVVRYLSEMQFVDEHNISRDGAGTQKANGKSYSHGVFIDPYDAGWVEYDLSRQYRRLVGEVGLEDKSSSGANAKVEIYGDDRLLTEASLPFGSTKSLDVDVTNILRLRIAVSVLDGQGAVVLGDVRVEGLESEVSASLTMTP